MDNTARNPEDLHMVGQGNEKKTDSSFVNPGTPANPLAQREDMPNAEVSKEATRALNQHLTDHR